MKPSFHQQPKASGGLFVLHAGALPDNAYDGQTLRDVLKRAESLTGCPIERRISRLRDPKSAASLYRPEAWRLRRHQARVPPFFRHRAHHGTDEERRPPRTLTPQGRRRRQRQRHPVGHRVQLPRPPRMAQGFLAPALIEMARENVRKPNCTHYSFLTDDYPWSVRQCPGSAQHGIQICPERRSPPCRFGLVSPTFCSRAIAVAALTRHVRPTIDAAIRFSTRLESDPSGRGSPPQFTGDASRMHSSQTVPRCETDAECPGAHHAGPRMPQEGSTSIGTMSSTGAIVVKGPFFIYPEQR